MGLFTILSWMFGFVFSFVFERIDDIFVWILPSYMTVYVIKEKKVKNYPNYLCFWVILALILGIEHVTFFLIYYWRIYRIIRLFFVIWLQIDYCSNAQMAFNLMAPFIKKKHEISIQKVFDKVTKAIDDHAGKYKQAASKTFWSFVSQNFDSLKELMFNAMSTVSKKAATISTQDSANNMKPSSSDIAGAATTSTATTSSSSSSKSNEKETISNKKES